MHILAFYTQPTLSILRRVKAPFHTLAQRGYSFSFMQRPQFQAEVGFGSDMMVLQNFVLDEQELDTYAQLCHEKVVVYDLTDGGLLHNEQVQETIRLATVVTVPNMYLKKDVELFAKKVRILPSVIDVPHFMNARSAPAPTEPIVGCFGPHDWHLVKGAIERIRQSKLSIHFWGDSYAVEQLGTDLVTPVSYTPDTYPALIRACAIGLCPSEGYTSIDTIWAHEYGILCRPVVASADSAYSSHLAKGTAKFVAASDERGWATSIIGLITMNHKRAAMGQAAFVAANEQRNTVKADLYRRVYREFLPHLA
jgi:hypothetical protein